MNPSGDVFLAIFDAAPAGIFVCDAAGRYLSVNPAFCDYLGYPESALRGKRHHDLTHPEDIDAADGQIASLLAAGTGGCRLEQRFIRQGGEFASARLGLSLVRLPGTSGLGVVGQILDPAAQAHRGNALLAAQERLEATQRIAHLGSWDADPSGRNMHWSKEIYRILGLDARASPAPGELLSHYLDAVHSADRQTVQKLISDAMLSKRERFAVDHRIIRQDKVERVVYLRGEPQAGADGKVDRYVGTLQDITERKRTEEDLLRTRRKLRALAEHQAGLVEEERKRIAREVHDDMGQHLTAVQFGLTLIMLRHGQDAQLAGRVSELQTLASDAIDIVRHLSTRLRPPVLDLGLLPAIEWLADDFRHRWELSCVVDVQGTDVVFGEPVAAALFRVVQESLNNIAKHAAASEVTITLATRDDRVSLCIVDDGQGFDPAVVRQMRGFGLLGMRERVLALGGTLFIKSARGQGTRVSIELPLQGPSA